jgi:hypothetical protein
VRGLAATIVHIDERGMVVVLPCAAGDCTDEVTCDACARLVRRRFVKGDSLRVRSWPFRVLAVAGRYVTLRPNERA